MNGKKALEMLLTITVFKSGMIEALFMVVIALLVEPEKECLVWLAGRTRENEQ